MCPVLEKRRIENGIHNDQQSTSTSFVFLLESIQALNETRSRLLKHVESLQQHEARSQLLALAGRVAACRPVNSLGVDDIMVSFHLFVAWEMLRERLEAWMHLQEAITMLQLLSQNDWDGIDVTSMNDQDFERFRLYCIL